MAKIYITSLGPIKKFEMEVKKINLFIGEQATGKSTISKAVFFFRTLRDILVEYLYNISLDGKTDMDDTFPKTTRQEIENYFIDLFGYRWNLPETLELRYEYKEGYWTVVALQKRNGKNYLSINFSAEFEKDMKAYEGQAYDFYLSNKESSTNFSFATTERLRMHQELFRKISGMLNDDMQCYYIPAGRSLMTLMTNQKTKLDYNTMDLINRKFMQFIESIQSKFDMGISQAYKYYPVAERKFDISKVVESLVNGLKGDYLYAPGKEFLQLNNSNEKIPINFTSSGQQEVLWLLNQLYILMLRDEKAFIVIEEPEAHLYPTLQKQVIEFIIQFANVTGSSVIITTHSPYVLTCMNNLLYAGRLQSDKTKDRVEKIIGKGKLVKEGELFACKLIKSKEQTVFINLIDKESHEIITESIDEISDTVNKAYTELFYLEEEDEDREKI
ncbi:MAG TPA: AAA family ATPase [Clostridiales bacterium]|nr:AAA family ATPase [Clostridiales bacterium]